MGVYIKGMEMPPSCNKCSLVTEYYEGGLPVCCLLDKYADTSGLKLDDCPLIPVQLHGRLIDADKFMRDECNSCDGACESIPCDCVNCHVDCRCEFMRDILDASTIIPAEE